MTKRDYFNSLLAINEVSSNEELVQFINHELELLDKKNSQRKPSKVALENASKKDALVALLTNEPMTIADIQAKGDETIKAMSVSSIAGLLRADSRVTRTEIKRKGFYTLA